MAGFQYDLNDAQIIRLNYAFAQRAPNPAELFSDGLHHSAARIELGDLRIKSESSSKISASYELSNEHWGLTIAPYFNAINDFVLLEPTEVEFTIRGAFPVWSYRQTNAELIGIDFSLYNNWTSKFRSNHKFSWVRGTDKENDIPLINIPAANMSNSVTYTHTNWKNLNISLESHYVFEQQRVPPNISVFSPQQQQEVILDINTAPPAYHLLSLDITSQFSIRNSDDLSLGVTITNLMNTNYRDYLNRQRYFVDDLGRNISLRIIYNY